MAVPSAAVEPVDPLDPAVARQVEADEAADSPDAATAARLTPQELAAQDGSDQADADTPPGARRAQRAAAANTRAERAAGELPTGRSSDTSTRVDAQVLGVAGLDGVSCEYATIEDAVSAAPDGGTVYVAPGVHTAQTPDVNYNLLKDLDVVQGTASCKPTKRAAATNVILQRNPASTVDAVVEIVGGAQVRLERITIETGNSAEGNVRVTGSDLVLDGAIIRNGSSPGSGGGLVVEEAASATLINGARVIDNTAATNGGGISLAGGGRVVLDDGSRVEGNTATDGAGIHATGGTSRVIVRNGSRVVDNDATADGGGVHLTDGALLTVAGAKSTIGTSTQGNGANRGGGVFVELGSVGSTAAVRDGGAVVGNEANFGAGFYLLNGTVRVDDGGAVRKNVGGNGAGILAVNNPGTTTVVDLNAGAAVAGNTGGLGAGVYASTDAVLDADGARVGGEYLPVKIADNTSSSSGGGIYTIFSEPVTLDGVRLMSNSAVTGGGAFFSSPATIGAGGCRGADLELETYCSEFRDNSATNGGAVYVQNADVTTSRTAFLDNTASVGAQAVEAVGSSRVTVRAAMILGHDSSASGDGSFTAKDTADLTVTGATVANPGGTQAAWFDLDGSATGSVSRVIATTNVLTGGAITGSCNLETSAGFGLPDAVVGDPGFVSTANSAFVPDAASPATDACPSPLGVPRDILGAKVQDGDGLPSSTEYDMGAIEATTGLGYRCFGKTATKVGDAGPNTIRGTGKADVIVALGGRDVIVSKGGSDLLCGGDGKDLLKAGGGSDKLDGGKARDVCDGQAGRDTARKCEVTRRIP